MHQTLCKNLIDNQITKKEINKFNLKLFCLAMVLSCNNNIKNMITKNISNINLEKYMQRWIETPVKTSYSNGQYRRERDSTNEKC